MAKMRALSLVALCFCLVILSQLDFTLSSKPTGFSLKLIPRDSPESPLYPGNLTYLERMERFMKFSEFGDNYLENLSHLNATIEPAVNLRLPIRRVASYYIVVTEIGSKRTRLYLFADAGSGLIWTQSKPCTNCFNQRAPMYDSEDSDFYKKLPCDHPFCSGDYPLFTCVNNECIYNERYGDGSSTRGVAATERFSFNVDQPDLTYIKNIVFGCSKDNLDFYFSGTGIISGILGLNKSPDSLISQLAYHVNYRFSYCLAPFAQSLQRPSILRFGNEIPPPPENAKTARFVDVPGGNLYYLKLMDISIGGVQLGFNPSQFEVRQDGSGGFLIDSGSIISRMDTTLFGERNAYDSVISAFRAYYDGKNLEREMNGPATFDLCYKYPPGFNDFATITYHFENADYHVEGQYNHYPGDLNLGYFCVAIKPFNGLSILGAWHQQNMRITYDINIDELQFASEDCLNDIL